MAKKKIKTDDSVDAPTVQGPRPRLHRLRVSNFRCIGSTPVEIELDDIVVLVGPNNAGKSSILRAYEVVMEQGSTEGQLTIDDFSNGQIDLRNLPTIELETVVFDKTAPGDKWVRIDPETNEMYVREKWTWDQPGKPKKVGWEVASGDWHEDEGPWGAPNVAQANRPEAHGVGAFQKPEDQAAKIIDLLSKAISERAKELSKRKADGQEGVATDYEQLLQSIKKLRRSIAKLK